MPGGYGRPGTNHSRGTPTPLGVAVLWVVDVIEGDVQDPRVGAVGCVSHKGGRRGDVLCCEVLERRGLFNHLVPIRIGMGVVCMG